MERNPDRPHVGSVSLLRRRLHWSLATTALWFAALAHLAYHHSNRPFVSVAQIQAAEIVVEGLVQERSPSQATVRVTSTHIGEVNPGQTLRIDLQATPAVALAVGKRYILPLTKAGDSYQITRYPTQSPPRAYPATEEARKQLAWALRFRLRNRRAEGRRPGQDRGPTEVQGEQTPAASNATRPSP